MLPLIFTSLKIVIAHVIFLSAQQSALASNPMPELLKIQPDGSFCFRRDYSERHLQRQPGQQTVSVLLSLQVVKEGGYFINRLEFYQRGQASPVKIGASCRWQENKGYQGDLIIASFPKKEGFLCGARVSNESAEEGGSYMLDVGGDASTIHLYSGGDSLSPWGSFPGGSVHDQNTGKWTFPPEDPQFKLGKNDRLFRLDLTDPAECATLVQSIEIDH